MDTAMILEELQNIFRNVLDHPDLVLTRESNAKTVEDWDSFAHISIVRVVEKEFGVRFALNEVGELQNVGEMADLIQSKLARTHNSH